MSPAPCTLVSLMGSETFALLAPESSMGVVPPQRPPSVWPQVSLLPQILPLSFATQASHCTRAVLPPLEMELQSLLVSAPCTCPVMGVWGPCAQPLWWSDGRQVPLGSHPLVLLPVRPPSLFLPGIRPDILFCDLLCTLRLYWSRFPPSTQLTHALC